MRKSSRKAISLAMIILILIVIGISIWTLESPAPMSVQSSEQEKGSLIASSPTRGTLNFSDPAGFFSFAFGFDYPNSSVAAGSPAVFKVYIALVSQQLSGFLARGVSLGIGDANLLVEGSVDKGVKVVTTQRPSLYTVSFDFVNTSIPAGAHNATARLLVSTTDDYYIGSIEGSTQVEELNGSFTIASH